MSDEIAKDYDWREVFKYAGTTAGEYSDSPELPQAVPPGSAVSTAPAACEDVVEIIAKVDGENDESDWVGVFHLKDGRFLAIRAGCDYTGWG